MADDFKRFYLQEGRVVGSSILMKREVSDDSEGEGESSQEWPPGLFDEIVALVAEALVLDYQCVSDSTVNSPHGIDRTIVWTLL